MRQPWLGRQLYCHPWGDSPTVAPTDIAATNRNRGSIKQLRYRVYTLERAVEIARGSIDRLAAVRLYVLIDGRESPEAFERLVRSLIDAGVHAIQLRDKRLADRDLLARARVVRDSLTAGTARRCCASSTTAPTWRPWPVPTAFTSAKKRFR